VPDQPNILVVGSINMDMVVRCDRIPAPGETVCGHQGLLTSPGGKGANQAVAAARMGGKVAMIGAVGTDAFGGQLLHALAGEGIDTSAVTIIDDQATGVAAILVDAHGDNAIAVAGGANCAVTADDHVYPHEHLFEQADIVLLQLEIPQPTVWAAAVIARHHGCKVILDPAPCHKGLCQEICRVDIICPNVLEAEMITGHKSGHDRADRSIALDLIARGAGAAVLKLGPRGSMVVTDDGQIERLDAYKVDIVDTTGAGDAFCGALAVAVAAGHGLPAAARIANAAGAIACTRLGAQSAMPTDDEVRVLMIDQA